MNGYKIVEVNSDGGGENYTIVVNVQCADATNMILSFLFGKNATRHEILKFLDDYEMEKGNGRQPPMIDGRLSKEVLELKGFRR